MPDEIILVVMEPSDEGPCDCPACAFEREAEKLIKELMLKPGSENDPRLN